MNSQRFSYASGEVQKNDVAVVIERYSYMKGGSSQKLTGACRKVRFQERVMAGKNRGMPCVKKSTTYTLGLVVGERFVTAGALK